MKQFVISQFGNPRGIAGWLVGKVMAYENRERIAWTIDRLDVQPEDRVLEIGVGPGLGVEAVARRTVHGWVAGVDRSQTMIGQAGRRNARAIGEGRVELRSASAEALPYDDEVFDKVVAINSFHHWSDPDRGLAECWRVLKRGGIIAIMEQPHGIDSEAAVRQRGEAIVAQLGAAEFVQATYVCEGLRRGAAVYVTGVKVRSH